MQIISEKFKSGLEAVFLFLIMLFIVYQLYYIRATPYEPTLHAVVHLSFAMVLVLLGRLNKNNLSRASYIFTTLLLVASVAVSVYFYTNYFVILQNPSFPPTISLYFGVAAAIITLILCLWSFGWIFPILIMISVGYILYGDQLTGMFRAPRTSFDRAVVLLATDVTSPWGLYGNMLGLSANYLFLFIIFGAILHAFGGLRFVIQVGSYFSSKLRSGTAALAIITSALLGSITGSSAANITVTGSFTIPLMKKSGYSPEQAGAIEAAASNGGQFLPPIMGATVFVMAAFTGIPYVEIAAAAVIPALLYFVILLMYAELNAIKRGLTTERMQINFRELLIDAPLFIVPLAVLLTLMIQGYSLMFVIFWSIISVITLGLLYSFLIRSAKLEWEEVKTKLVDGVMTGANIAIILAAIGIFVAVLEVTGLSMRLSVILSQIAGDSVPLLLFFTMVTSLILGIGLPTPAAYVVVATVLSPLLVKNGVPLLQAHLFPLFFAIVSHLTPPVGIGLIVACNIAGSKFYGSAIEVFKAAYACLLLPFAFIYSPAILLIYDRPSELFIQVGGLLLFFFAFSVLLNNQWRHKLNSPEKGILLVATLLSLLFVFGLHELYLMAISALACLAALFMNTRRQVEDKDSRAASS